MFGNRIEDEFANSLTSAGAAVRDGGPGKLLLVLALGLAAFLAWAATHEIEETAHAPGRVIPSRQVQVVQSLEGGIIREIAVQEGDIVEEGAVLMQIDDTRFSSERGELLEREAALLAEEARLLAEADMADELAFPEGLEGRNPLSTAAERQVFTSRRAQLAEEIAVLAAQLVQVKAEREELLAQRTQTEEILAPLSDEIALTEDMVARGLVPEVEFLRLKSRRAELSGAIAISRASEPRIEAAIAEVESRIEAARSAYVLSARERLARLQVELAVVQENLRAADDRVSRTTMRAPVRGTVNTITYKTLGAVVQPGAPLIEIVPMDDSLLIEADLGPRDIAFVRLGERASVKITAYDYTIYGALAGEVVRIGADTLRTEEGTEFFRVVVRTDRAYLGTDENPHPIAPGMIASVDIQTGRKTVLSYLAKPILRARAEALRER
ncbi:HlyD family type I secretion periplasmic adaptor subunit [Sulfitobacter sp. LCG007]